MENQITDELYERLCAYVFGELQGEERTAFEAELETNAALAAERDQLEASANLVRTFAPAAPVELSAETRAALTTAAATPGGGAPAAGTPSGGGLKAVPGGKAPWYMHPALQVAAAAGIAIVGFRALEDAVQFDAPHASADRIARSEEAPRVRGLDAESKLDGVREKRMREEWTKQYEDLNTLGVPASAQPEASREEAEVAEGAIRPRVRTIPSGENTVKQESVFVAGQPSGRLEAQGYLGKSGGLTKELAEELRALGYVGDAPSEAPALEALGYIEGPSINRVKAETGSGDWFLGSGEAVTRELNTGLASSGSVSVNVPKVQAPAGLGGGAGGGFDRTQTHGLGNTDNGSAWGMTSTPSSGGRVYRGPGDSMAPPPGASGPALEPSDKLELGLGLFVAGGEFNAPDAVKAELQDLLGLGLNHGGTGEGAASPSGGFFYADGKDGEFKASTSTLFDNPLGGRLGQLEEGVDADVLTFGLEAPERYSEVVANSVRLVLERKRQDPNALEAAALQAGIDLAALPQGPVEQLDEEGLHDWLVVFDDEDKASVAAEVATEVIEIRAAEEAERLRAEEARIEAQYQQLLGRLERRPDEKPSMMYFRFWGDNGFEFPVQDALSTFAADVDTASYTLARNYIQKGYLPERAQIRTEEFVNYFTPDVPAPTDGRTFNVTHELAPNPFGPETAGTVSFDIVDGEVAFQQALPNRWTLRVGVRGEVIPDAERDPLALTFVIDVSGSMEQENRLELVKHSLRMLVNELGPDDQIAIVTFANDARRLLTMQSASNRSAIETALYSMSAGGGTNAEGGLLKGYEEAVLGFTEGAVNRVVFLSDGVGNIGETNEQSLLAEVKRAREKGIYLNTVGVGMGNHNDRFLEQLANGGDGLCNYVDGPAEAERALVTNFTSAMQPIARDVKLQVEFDPEQVVAYRLLGYENRAIADADFRNDKVDAGELGSGHQVVALYELVLKDVDTTGARPLCTTRVRHKVPYGELEKGAEDVATEMEVAGTWADAKGSFEQASAGFQKSALAAQFAEFLRRSTHAKDESVSELRVAIERLDRATDDAEVKELAALVQLCQGQLEKALRQADAPAQAAYDELASFEWGCTQRRYRGLEVDEDQVARRRGELRQNLRDALK